MARIFQKYVTPEGSRSIVPPASEPIPEKPAVGYDFGSGAISMSSLISDQREEKDETASDTELKMEDTPVKAVLVGIRSITHLLNRMLNMREYNAI